MTDQRPRRVVATEATVISITEHHTWECFKIRIKINGKYYTGVLEMNE